MNTLIHNINLLLFILLFTTTIISKSYSAEEGSSYAVSTYEYIGCFSGEQRIDAQVDTFFHIISNSVWTCFRHVGL